MYAYQVQHGDTPKEVALKFTGDGGRVYELINANPQKSWTYIFGHPTFTSLNTDEILIIPNQWLGIGLAGAAPTQVGVGARTKQLAGIGADQAGVGYGYPSPPSMTNPKLVNDTISHWMRQNTFGLGEAAPAQNTALRAQLGDANSWRTNLADSSPDDGTKIASYLTSINKSRETAQEAARIAGVASNKWPNRVDIKAAYQSASDDEKYIREIILPAASGSSAVSEAKSFADSAWAKAREAVEKAELAETLATSTPNEGGPVPTGGYSFDTHGCLTGAGVKHLQNTLHALGFYDGPIDGVYTYKTGATWAAVTKFQAANGLTVDGCAGKGTMAKLDAVLAGKPPQTAPTPAPAPAPAPAPIPAPVPGPTPVGPGAQPVAYTTAMDWTPWLIGGAALLVGGALVVYMRKQQAAGHPVHLPKQLTSFTKRLGKKSRIRRKGRR